MPGNNSLEILMTQRENGEIVSTLALDYPSLENAAANVLSLDLVDAISAVIEKWAGAKAAMTGEAEMFESVTAVRKGLFTAPGQAKK
jgi:hypothetical protein